MSKKRQGQRANHNAKEKEQGEKIVKWIFGVLIVLALCFMVFSMGLIG